MSFGFAANSTSVRLRLSPEKKTLKASSRNFSHRTGCLVGEQGGFFLNLVIILEKRQASLSEGA